MHTPSIDVSKLSENFATSVSTNDSPITFNVAPLTKAPVSNATVDGVGTTNSVARSREPKLKLDIVQLIMETAVRLATPNHMSRELANFRVVNHLFLEIAHNIERQTSDIAYASTSNKTLNVLTKGQPDKLRQPTIEALYKCWPHIKVPLSEEKNADSRNIMLDALAKQVDKASLSLQLHDIGPGEFEKMRLIASNNPNTPIELNLQESTLTSAEMKELLQPFAEHRSLVKLSLDGSNLDSQAFQELIPVIARFTKLESLKFTNVHVTPEAMQELAQVLTEFKSLVELDLSGNQIGPEAMRELAAKAEQLPPIEHFSLNNNPLGSDGLREFYTLLNTHQSSIISLDLNSVGINYVGAMRLAYVLPTFVNLRQLSLERNPVDDVGMRVLMPVLAEHPAIKELRMTNNAVGLALAKEFAEDLADKNHSLQYLCLDWADSGIGDREEIAPILAKIESLKTLILPEDRDGELEEVPLEEYRQ